MFAVFDHEIIWDVVFCIYTSFPCINHNSGDQKVDALERHGLSRTKQASGL